MDDSLGVRVVKGVGQLDRRGPPPLDGRPRLTEALPAAVHLPAAPSRGNRALVVTTSYSVQMCGWFRPAIVSHSALEAAPGARGCTTSGRENLDGDGAVEAGVAGLVDLAHAALRQSRTGSRTAQGAFPTRGTWNPPVNVDGRPTNVRIVSIVARRRPSRSGAHAGFARVSACLGVGERLTT